MSILTVFRRAAARAALARARSAPRPTAAHNRTANGVPRSTRSSSPRHACRNRSPQVLADVTVIGSDEILRSGVQSLAELLQRQPGVEIEQNGGPGGTSGALSARRQHRADAGADRRLAGGFGVVRRDQLEAIPLDQIDHIEILRGPASSLYGADAIGGVVQVFTKRTSGSTFTPNFSAGYGTYNTGAVSRGICRNERIRCATRCRSGGRTSDGFNAITNPDNFSYNPDRDGFNDARISRPISAGLGPQGRSLSAQYFGNRLNAQFDGGAPYFDDRTITTVQAWSVNEPQQGQRRLDVAADRGRRQRRFRVADELRQLPVQDDAAPILLAERSDAAAGRAGRDPRAARGAPVDRRRLRGDAAQYQFGHRRLSASLRRISRCRPICAATIRPSTAARRPAAWRSAIRCRPRGA